MEFIFVIAILIFSVVLHEVSHGVVANSLGDPTAKNAGRLTLNPIPHLDPIGSILLPGIMALFGGFIIGWAKPVPVNPLNFKDRKFGSLKVGFAGPASNLAIALVFGLALRFLPLMELNPAFVAIVSSIVIINIMLAALNLLPIPPLDGAHILFTFLPRSLEYIKIGLSRYGIFILLFIVFFTGILGLIVNLLFVLLVGKPINAFPNLF
ncbi:site-2 protease family protein [Patescibacteria group bacterium]|nr:site-2 protease family protein [Patescibacteria group bacterium]MCH8048530.1 site-2 protease family protein [Patescibacteria group bacterium]